MTGIAPGDEGAATAAPDRAINITYHRAKKDERLPGRLYSPDYWIHLDGLRCGYVQASHPGRSGGTTTSWRAMANDGTLFALSGSMRNMKVDVAAHLARNPHPDRPIEYRCCDYHYPEPS